MGPPSVQPDDVILTSCSATVLSRSAQGTATGAKDEPKADDPVAEDPQRPFPGTAPAEVLEEGRVFFLYRPRVNVEHPESLTDVQRFFMVLSPTSRWDLCFTTPRPLSLVPSANIT